jgi:hypothetical protein
LSTCVLDVLPDNRRTNQNQEQQPEFGDGSGGPLFLMYWKMTEEEDNKMVKRWQKDAEGIIIFVSPHLVSILHIAHQAKNYRLDCSLPPLRHYLR